MQVMALKVGHVTGWGWTCSSSAPHQRLGVNALRAFVVSAPSLRGRWMARDVARAVAEVGEGF